MDDEKLNDLSDVNERLKYNLYVLSTMGPLRKRQEALKQCISILGDKKYMKSHSGSGHGSVFSFGLDQEEKRKKGELLDSLTLKYFMESFKKPFWKQIEDKHISIQKECINLLYVIIKNYWLYIKKYINYYMKKLLIYFEKNDVKSTRKLIEPTIKLIIRSLNFGDDKIIVVMIIAELIQFATKCRSKMVKKHSWIYLGLCIKKQIKYQQELPSASSSPSYAMDSTNNSNKNYSFTSGKGNNKSPQNMLDLIQSGLKKGISDSDKSTQAEAMSVLTLFTILDETRAERLISRMSGNVMRQYRKHEAHLSATTHGNIQHHKKYSLSSPRASLTMMSPKNNALVSPRSKSLKSPRRDSTDKNAKNKTISPKTATAVISTQMEKKKKNKSLKKEKKKKAKTQKITKKEKGQETRTKKKKSNKPPIAIPSINTTDEEVQVIEVDEKDDIITIKEPQRKKKPGGAGGGGFKFGGISLDTSGDNDDNDNPRNKPMVVITPVDDETKENIMSDDPSSTDTDDDSLSVDSGDSDDDNNKNSKRKKSSLSIPSIATNEKDNNNNDGSDGSGSDDSDEDDEDERQQQNIGFGMKKSFKIVSTKKKSQAFKMPSLNTAMSKSATIYDRNTNIKPKKPSMPGLARPSSAKFGSDTGLKSKSRSDASIRSRSGSAARGGMRPSSARAAGGDKKMSFALDISESEDEEDALTPRSPNTPSSVDSDSDSSSSIDSDISSSSDEDDEDINIGLSSGPQKDINTFRQNVNNGYMPKSTSITYDGLLNEYYFDTKDNRRNFEGYDDEKEGLLFYPSYCYGRVNTMKILQNLPYPTLEEDDEYDDTTEEDEDDVEYKGKVKEFEHYLTIGLNSNVNEKNFERNKLNLVVLLDQSGSMGSTFNNDTGKSKMMIANECLCRLLDELNDDDRFALISFDDEIFIHTESKLELIKNIDKEMLKEKIMNIKQNGGTNFELAYEKSNEFYEDLFNSSKEFKTENEGYDNRVIMLTDACPNVGATDPHSLLHLFRKNCEFPVHEYKRIYTTYVVYAVYLIFVWSLFLCGLCLFEGLLGLDWILTRIW